MRNINWIEKRPQSAGRFWWTAQAEKGPTLGYIEEHSLGFYVLGVGWLAYQSGQWAGPMGDPAAAKN